MKLFTVSLVVALSVVSSLTLAAGKEEEVNTRVYYRYVNEQGNTVLNHSIPPKYIPQGYQIVSLSGEVLRVVEPALSEEETARIAREKAQKAQQDKSDALLRHRYSNTNDIEAIKKRTLLELQSNVDILNATLSSTRTQIDNHHTRAASLERSGRTVPAETLKIIADLEAEEKDLQVQIKQREAEYQTQSDVFDEDLKRFKELLKEEEEKTAKP
jgi:hypothetical protein